MAPDIGDIIKKVGSDLSQFGEHSYRVTGWLKALPEIEAPAEDADWQTKFMYEIYLENKASGEGRHGPDKKRLVWCVREEAEYVTGYSVCGVIWRVADCEVIGNVTDVRADGKPGWSAQDIEQERSHALSLINQRVI